MLHDENRGNTVVWKLRRRNAELSRLPVDNIIIYIERGKPETILRIFQIYHSQIQSYTNLLCTLLPSGM
jgi:hypothetical protein